MKIKFNSDDELPLNKKIKIPSMIIIVRAVFHESNKYCSHVFLKEYLYFNIFLLIALVLLIAFGIYCYLIKYKAKQKHLLSFYATNNKMIIALHYTNQK